ncbi:tigger transposable element-derived protein 4-like [Mya arenaria]|uniref:tigger transposable element-derived protein 4-like n=1 Tax=Mya arenaria TaxID=6604 RepID=UPI0022E29F34|nr:tigger transposable element-derived protein 4-like [Mya arenaria]
MTGNEELNELVYKWFMDACARLVTVSGPLIQTKAKKYAEELGLTEFKASNGWLESFLTRHNIVFKKQGGERGEVNPTTVAKWLDQIPSLCEGYSPEDIFNMDETGLFYRESSRSTFYTKGEDCAGGKRAKERITVALCASMTGEKLKPVVIGKARKPRCFGSISVDKLPVKYYSNKTAWMHSWCFEDWVKSLDQKMRAANRHILLFVDNAPVHPNITLRNVKLLFFPKNCTSVFQPMDAGIIQTLKLKYRKRQLAHVLSEMDRNSSQTGPEILKV